MEYKYRVPKYIPDEKKHYEIVKYRIAKRWSKCRVCGGLVLKHEPTIETSAGTICMYCLKDFLSFQVGESRKTKVVAIKESTSTSELCTCGEHWVANGKESILLVYFPFTSGKRHARLCMDCIQTAVQYAEDHDLFKNGINERAKHALKLHAQPSLS